MPKCFKRLLLKYNWIAFWMRKSDELILFDFKRENELKTILN
jgi:hypothetical protein